ncbi:MAG: glycosyltransferase family 39 protein [Patescibacteria group bacterium]
MKIEKLFNSRRKLVIIFILILFIGLVLRITNISNEEYWVDEVVSMEISRYSDSLAHLTAFIQQGEYHPPLYYYAMFFWTRALGTEPLSTRSFSVIFGIASLILFYFFVKKVFSYLPPKTSVKIALLAMTFLAVNPLHIEFSKEARPYTFFTFFGLLSCYFLLFLLEKRKWYFWLGLIASNIIGLYIHYSYFFIVAVQGVFLTVVWLFQKYRPGSFGVKFSLKELFYFFLATITGFSLWLPTVINRFFESQTEIYGARMAFGSGYDFFWLERVTENLLWLEKYYLSGKSGPVIIFFAEAAIVGLLIYLFKVLKNQIRKESLWRFMFLSILFGGVLFFYFASNLSIQYTPIVSRHILFAVFPLLALVSYAIYTLKNYSFRFFLTIFILISFVVVLPQVINSDSNWNKEYRVKELAQYIRNSEQPNDLIVFNDFRRVLFNYYYQGKITVSDFFPYKNFEKSYELSNYATNSLENKFSAHIITFENNNPIHVQYLDKLTQGHNRVWVLLGDQGMRQYFINHNWLIQPLNYNVENIFQPVLFVKR